MKALAQAFKKVTSIAVSTSMIYSYGFAQTSQVCTLISSHPYGYTGDVTGKRVYTKEEFTYECTETTTKTGPCARYEYTQQDFNVSNLEHDVFYQTEDFSGGLGSALAISQAYDKINGVWSGWHGLCQDGVDDGNWDWTSDPYVIGGMALSLVGGSAAAGVDNGIIGSVGQYSSETVKYATRTAVCAARAGLDVASMMEDYADDGEPCDPVDEICGGDDVAQDNGNIFTVPEAEYQDILAVNPEMEKSVVILDGVGTGVLTLKVVNPGIDTSAMTSAEAKAAAKEAKEMTLKINAAMTTVQLVACVRGADAGSGSSASSSDGAESLLSAKSLALMALGAINPLLGLAASLVSNIYDSVSSSIDTCHDEDDAKAKGSRHLATYNSVPLGLCHFIESIETGSDASFSKQTRYRYCCYDNKTTRILVEQAKAQFAKDWQHCTDITLKELAVISFNSCDPVALDAAVNGVDLPSTATLQARMGAYQFVNKCIDTREFIKEILDKYAGGDLIIDTKDAERIIEEMR